MMLSPLRVLLGENSFLQNPADNLPGPATFGAISLKKVWNTLALPGLYYGKF